MANELQASYSTGKTVYFLIRNNIGQIWNGTSFVAYVTANLSTYAVSATEQGTASGYYTATFPATIVAGTYAVVAKNQTGGSPAETDGTVAAGNLEWNGSTIAPLSDTATSGLVGQFLPQRVYRGQQILSFPFKLVSATDHITPFTSGVISGQISRDGGAFGALQSGGATAGYAEIGLGWYQLKGLTSGDLLATTVALTFSATGISGGTSDPRDTTFILQRTSGQN